MIGRAVDSAERLPGPGELRADCRLGRAFAEGDGFDRLPFEMDSPRGRIYQMSTAIVTANPGCMLQLRAGVAMHGSGQRVMHVVEVLDEAYRG